MGDAERTVVSSEASHENYCGLYYCWQCFIKKDSCNAKEGSSSVTPEESVDAQVERYLNNFPVGLKFRPSDEEAVLFYLVKRSRNEPLPISPIKEVNIYEFTPEDLLDRYKNYGIEGIEGKELYVFTPRERKYPNGSRPARYITGRYIGFWKIVGRADPIPNERTHIGTKRSLRFFKGTKDDFSKTPFSMTEYILKSKINSESGHQNGGKKQDPVNLALCKIWKRLPSKKDLSPVAESSTENTDTTLLENAEYNSSGPVMEAHQGSSATNMVMPTGNENSSHTNGFLQDYHIEDATNSYDSFLNDEDMSFEQLDDILDCVLGDTNTEFNTFGQAMGPYQDFNLMDTVMRNDGSFSNINRSSQDQIAMEETFLDPFRLFGDNYLPAGEKQNGELQVALNQENQFESSSVVLNDLDICGSSCYNHSSYHFDEQK
ncbi:NAC transcription factor 29-like [Papaver somniferum]|uniref:NAC transcription factor 29-like n=1 Tax=Papaver somniferum TaxID=3469 RepID=UPI000E6FA3AD|nr:NAC transcription factor 29-like [Papaver somniferum]